MKVWDENYSAPSVNFTRLIQYEVNDWVPWDDSGETFDDGVYSQGKTIYFEAVGNDPDEMGGNISKYCWEIEYKRYQYEWWNGWVSDCVYDYQTPYSRFWYHYENPQSYYQEGDFRAKVRVYDDDGDWSQWSDWTDWYEFTVSQAPHRKINTDYVEVDEGENVTLSSTSFDQKDQDWHNPSITAYRWYLDDDFSEPIGDSNSLTRNYTDGFHYVELWVKDEYGIWSYHCDNPCETTIKVWPQGGEEDNPSIEWFDDDEWDTMDLDSNGQDDSIIFHYDPDTDTEQIDVDVFVLIDKDGSYYDQTFKSYVIQGEEDDWFDLEWTATESGYYTFTVYLYDDNGNLEDIFDAYNVYLEGFDENSAIDYEEWFEDWEIIPWDKDQNGNDDTVMIDYDPNSMDQNQSFVDVFIFVYNSNGDIIDGAVFNHEIFGSQLDIFAKNWSAYGRDTYTFEVRLYDSEGHFEDSFNYTQELEKYNGIGGFEGPDADEWFDEFDWTTEDKDKDGSDDTFVIKYNPDTDALISVIKVEIVAIDEAGSESLVNTNHTIYDDNYDEFSLEWIAADTGNYDFVITLYDSRNNIEDTVEINEVYLHAISGLIPLEITELGGQDGNEGDKIDFEGHVNDPNGLYSEEEILFSWDFGDDSDLVEGYGLTTPKHIYQDDGVYTVILTVSVDTLESSRVAFVFVSNVPPEIIGISQNGNKEGEEVLLIGNARDVYYDNITYLWDFGEGGTGTGRNITHVFGDNGNYSVILTVFDDDKSYNSSTFIVSILNVAPSIPFEEVNITIEELTVTMIVSVYDVPADDLTVVWYFGDDSSEVGFSVVHTYAEAGDYEARVCATDDDGGRTCQDFVVSVKSGGRSSPDSPLPSLSLPLAIFGLALIAVRRRARF